MPSFPWLDWMGSPLNLGLSTSKAHSHFALHWVPCGLIAFSFVCQPAQSSAALLFTAWCWCMTLIPEKPVRLVLVVCVVRKVSELSGGRSALPQASFLHKTHHATDIIKACTDSSLLDCKSEYKMKRRKRVGRRVRRRRWGRGEGDERTTEEHYFHNLSSLSDETLSDFIGLYYL